MQKSLLWIPAWFVVVSAAALAQEPVDAAAVPAPTGAAEQVLRVREQFAKDLAEAAAAVLAEIDAKIAKLEKDSGQTLESRAKAKTEFERLKQSFVQNQEVPAKEFPQAARRYHDDVDAARRKCRKAVIVIAKRVQPKDPSAAVSITQDLDSYCPRLVGPSAFLRAMKPVLKDISTPKKAHASVVKIRAQLDQMIADCALGSLTAEKVSEGCRGLSVAIKSSPIYLDESKLFYKPLQRAAEAVDALLERES